MPENAPSSASNGRLLRQSIRRKEEIRRLTAELADRDRKLAAAEAERDELAGRYEELDGQFRAIEEDPAGPLAALAELQSELDRRDHADAFRSLYDDPELGLNKSIPADDLMRVLGHKAEGVPDAAALKAAIAGLKADKPYLFGPPAESAPGGGKPGDPPNGARAPLPAGPGSGRGDRGHDLGRFRVRRSDTSDADWMRANQGRLSQEIKAGNVEYID